MAGHSGARKAHPVKWPEHEALCSAKVKNVWIFSFNPSYLYIFMV
jgi:hypothetical protein